MEHYRSEIEAVIEKGCGFGLFDGEIESCHECRSCGFSDSNNAFDGKHTCSSRRIDWLMSEYKPEPVLIAREKHFVEFAQEGWLARDRGGSLYQHRGKPYKKDEREWSSTEGFLNMSYFDVDALFPFITWEDEEPWSVEELRELKVEE